MSGPVLVVVEVGNGEARPVSFELVAAANAIAGAVGSTVTALVVGVKTGAAAQAVAATGVARVLVADDDRFEQLPAPAVAAVVAQAVTEIEPFAILVGSTTAGIEFAPRVAARLDLPMAAECVGLSVEDGALVAVRPVLGGRVQSAVRFTGDGPVIATVRQGSFERAAAGTGSATPEPFAFTLDDADLRIEMVGIAAKERAGVGLDTAETIVGGGRGLKEAKNFELVEQLAAALDGAVAATRAVTDAGWRPHNEQIGQTGRVVSPRLYIAVGISGAVQHVAGLQGAEHIVVINRDPDAPIFKLASFGIVGDLFEVVPAIIAELKAST
jgi:electron transfer flavoprotein alpha subunit